MSGMITFHGRPHPFRQDRVTGSIEHGATVAQIVERGLNDMHVPASLRGHGHAYVGERYVPREAWETTRPLPGDIVTYRVVPQGGGNNKALRGILTIVIMAVAVISQQYYLAEFAQYTAAGALTTGSAMMSAGIMAGVSAVGMLAMNALLPMQAPSLPSSGSSQDSPTYSTSGARNIIDPFGPVAALLGRHRIVPKQGALPYSELVGNDQFVRQLFVLGYAPVVPRGQIKIGETPIDDFEDVQYEYIAYATADTIPKYYTNDVYERQLSIELTEPDGWQTRVTDQECDRFSIDLSCVRGLIKYDEDGDKEYYTVQAEVQYRKQGDGDDAWKNMGGDADIPAEKIYLDRAGGYVNDGGERVWQNATQWWTLVCTQRGDLVAKAGAVGSGPPSVRGDDQGIAQICVVGSSITSIVYILPDGASGFEITPGSPINIPFAPARQPYIDIAAGVMPLESTTIIGKQTSAIRRSWGVSPGERAYYEVRTRRITPETDKDNIMDDLWWTAIRAIKFVNPIKFSQPVSIISTRIKATGQLNGAIDELNVEAESECLDWDEPTETWVQRATNNPASLFRHVLQHPGLVRKVSDAQIDLDDLVYWHNFCRINGLTYNRYHDFRMGTLEALSAIALAGLAAPGRPNGKWTVVIDEPRSGPVQHFTPQNSWGFRGTKVNLRMPHGWRSRFVNENAEWQNDERIVYADGYDEGTATEFEGVEFQGVTDPDQIWKLCRHQLAVAKLRPEEYELWADMEHIVCTRGDWVKCSHDVTMWGLSSGRFKAVDEVAQTVTVDNACPMMAGTSYNIRWRSSSGASVVRNVVTNEGEQTVLDFSGTDAMPEVGDLWSFGPVGQETADLMVKHIQPSDNFSARLLLVDYSPAIYDAATGTIPEFNTNITRPYASMFQTPPVPIILSVRSDEAVLVRNPDGSLTSRICLAFTIPSGSTVDAQVVQAQCRESGSETWIGAGSAPVGDGQLYIEPVEDGQVYDLRIRTATTDRASAWGESQSHLVVGKTSVPPDVTGFAATAVETGVYLTWGKSAHKDVSRYVIRLGADWETGTTVFDGDATSKTLPLVAAGSYHYWIKAFDIIGLESETAADVEFVPTGPSAPDVGAGIDGANVVLSWAAPVSVFPIVEYEVRVGSEWASATFLGRIKGTQFSTPGPAVGSYTYLVAAIDAPGNVGEAGQVGITVSAPGAVSVSPQVIDNQVLLKWTEPPAGTFPVKEYEARKGATWATADPIGKLSGRFSTIFEAASGSYTYWIAAIDVVGNAGTPAAATASVSSPPDYERSYDDDSDFSGTLTSAFLGADGLLIPANTTETWDQHFTSNSWASPQAQIDAGYPYYLEPTPASGSYQEVIDYGEVLPGTKITITPTVEIIHGSVALSCEIEIRELDTDPWASLGAGFEAYATEFRYVRYTITATPDGGANDLALISRINVVMASKLINDAGTATCSAADSGGTSVNFGKDFVRVSSITITPKAGGTARFGVWSYNDGDSYFKILLYDINDDRASGDASWSAKGV